MFKHSVAATFAAVASVAFSSLLLVAATPSPARAAEIKLLSPFSFRALLPEPPTAIREVIGVTRSRSNTPRSAPALNAFSRARPPTSRLSRPHKSRNCRSRASCLRAVAWRSPGSATPHS